MKKEEEKEELFIPKTKHKVLKIIIGIILIAGLIVGGYFLYQYKFNNPKTIVNTILADAKEKIRESLINDSNEEVYKVDGFIKVDANLGEEASTITDLFKDVEIAFNGEVDPNNSIGNLTINTKYKNDKLIDIKTYYEKSVVYLLIEDIYDKYLKFNTSQDQGESILSTIPDVSINKKEMQSLYKALLDALIEEVNKQDIEKTDATITIDEKEVNVINNYIELKGKEVNTFIKNFIKDLKNNKSFTETLKKLTDKDISELFSSLLLGIDSDEFQGTYRLSFYTDKGLFNKKLVSIRQTISQSGTTMSFNVDKIADDEVEVSMSMMGMVYSIRVKKTDSVFNLTIKESILGMYLKVELNMNYEKIKEVTKPDLSNSKDINDLTDKEGKKIEENLAKNKALEKFYKELNKNEDNEA